ncbi:hypothetical protein CWE12_02240 [Aliidiomarina sedimenti]|uniref:Lipoprotein SmpA/OmlA domain-containing protein n=1 Tax=Aliidiomarina sedimenti TaxID=1933879 RepID=A0ABY0C276_9GAMM|nr:hypothetical protein [Aliidiomarina sedimenti]RUO31839.1 hypothetical protein CWE12_02240 [Aliidiomarina sedimenti]
MNTLQSGLIFTVSLLLAACTTTTRSVNESPTDPATSQIPGQRDSARSSAGQRQSFDTLQQDDVDRLIIRGQTHSGQIANWFGRPHSVTRSGEEVYWNYSHQFRDEGRGQAGLKALNVLFNQSGLVVDYEFQNNTFAIE